MMATTEAALSGNARPRLRKTHFLWGCAGPGNAL